MADSLLYVYAIGRNLDLGTLSGLTPVGKGTLAVVNTGGLFAVVSEVPAAEFSQESIDAHANDVEWLAAIGYAHQDVVSALAAAATIVPLRAFSLFSSRQVLERYLTEDRPNLVAALDRLEGKEEWTLRIELDPERWSAAVLRRDSRTRELQGQISSSPAGKAYLLQKKLDEEKRKAAKRAEEELVEEVAREMSGLAVADSTIENRLARGGSFPQIDLLVPRGSGEQLERKREEIGARFAEDGVKLVLTGPWPPYSFVGAANG